MNQQRDFISQQIIENWTGQIFYTDSSFQGCYNKFLHIVSDNLNLVFGCLIGVGAVQFVAIVFAFCICKVRYWLCILYLYGEILSLYLLVEILSLHV